IINPPITNCICNGTLASETFSLKAQQARHSGVSWTTAMLRKRKAQKRYFVTSSKMRPFRLTVPSPHWPKNLIHGGKWKLLLRWKPLHVLRILCMAANIFSISY
ncbi:hypothetical protein H0H92_001580, partial [Tricholoma furcatifolium]